MNIIVKILISIIVSLLITSLSSIIFNALDVEPYIYIPYVYWFISIIILFLFLPSEKQSLFNENNK